MISCLRSALTKMEAFQHQPECDVNSEFYTGQAMDAYVVPKHGLDTPVLGGTMPMCDKDKGGLFAEVHRMGENAPGPSKYQDAVLTRSFVQNAKGGKFSTMQRVGLGGNLNRNAPSVGSYEVGAARDMISPRVKGGKMTQKDRKNVFWDAAVRNTQPAPNRYNPQYNEANVCVPSFAKPITSPRINTKAAALGPGHYTPNFTNTEKRVIAYVGSKSGAQSYLDELLKKKDKTPAPGHVDVRETGIEDRAGKVMHAHVLLRDRPVTVSPRQIDSAR